MSEAPERIVIAGTLDECGSYYPNATEAEGEHGGAAVEYIRADIHAARISDLERQLAEARTEAEVAVALAYQRACEPVEANFPGTLYASNRTKTIAAILALAPAEALAEVERMRADRDEYREAFTSDNADLAVALLSLTAAEAEVTRLRGCISIALGKMHPSENLLVWNTLTAALTTPEKDTP